MDTQEISRLQQIINDHEKRLAHLESLFTVNKVIAKRLSVKEFLLEKQPNNDVSKTLVICYYLEKLDGLTSYNIKDIEGGFRRAKEPVPVNINYKVIKNIEAGYLMEAEEKKDKLKAWCLTNTGEGVVNNGFKKD
jgi:hypothetical protein